MGIRLRKAVSTKFEQQSSKIMHASAVVARVSLWCSSTNSFQLLPLKATDNNPHNKATTINHLQCRTNNTPHKVVTRRSSTATQAVHLHSKISSTLHLETTLLHSKVTTSRRPSRTMVLLLPRDNTAVPLPQVNTVLPEALLRLNKVTTSRPRSRIMEHLKDSTHLPALGSQVHRHKHLLAMVHKRLRK